MRVLGIDTATEACSVALSGVGDTIIERYQVEPRGHSKLVLTMAESVLSEAGISRQDLDVIPVDSGPGAFTGVRIGLGVAQGLSLGLDLPLLCVSSLMALAEGSGVNAVLSAIDARMGEVYWARLVRNQNSIEGWVWRDQAQVDAPTSVPRLLADEIGIGSGWDSYVELVDGNSPTNIKFGVLPRAAWIVQIAARIMSLDNEYVSSGLPTYVREKFDS